MRGGSGTGTGAGTGAAPEERSRSRPRDLLRSPAVRILVTGGAGFIGSHVAEALAGRGHEVVVLDDLSSGRRRNVPAGVTFVQGDIRDEAALERVFDDHRPEIVSHQAAQTSVVVSTREPVRDADINVLGGIRVLEAARRRGVRRFVFASTGGAIYGEVPPGEKATVGWPLRPMSPYACSKLAFEHYLLAAAGEHGLPITILRYANVYGPRQDPHGEAGVVAIFSRRILHGEPLRINAMREVGDDGCVRDYVYVADVVRANVLAIDGGVPQAILDVCTGQATTTGDIARGLVAALGGAPRLEHGPRRAGDLERSVLDERAFIGLLGPVTSLADGLAATARFFRDHPD
jgi:UDP-glucose 4-epimerase